MHEDATFIGHPKDSSRQIESRITEKIDALDFEFWRCHEEEIEEVEEEEKRRRRTCLQWSLQHYNRAMLARWVTWLDWSSPRALHFFFRGISNKQINMRKSRSSASRGCLYVITLMMWLLKTNESKRTNNMLIKRLGNESSDGNSLYTQASRSHSVKLPNGPRRQLTKHQCCASGDGSNCGAATFFYLFFSVLCYVGQ